MRYDLLTERHLLAKARGRVRRLRRVAGTVEQAHTVVHRARQQAERAERATRDQMARVLVTQTALPLTEVAARCGWASTRPVLRLLRREHLTRPHLGGGT